MAKFFGILLIISGAGLFLGVFAGKPDAGGDIVYAIGFIGLGIYLLSRGKSKPQPPQKSENG